MAELGDFATLSGTLPLTHLDKGALRFAIADGIAYDLQLANTGNGVVLSGIASAQATTECSRCLEQAIVVVEGEVEGYFILKPKDEDLELADDEFSVVGADGIVDLAPAIIAAIVFELPQVVLCSEDCAGLCPSCGVNRNITACDCADAPPTDGPFAALSNLL